VEVVELEDLEETVHLLLEVKVEQVQHLQLMEHQQQEEEVEVVELMLEEHLQVEDQAEVEMQDLDQMEMD
jgi:D-hexose-6-phosphate mutarotase